MDLVRVIGPLKFLGIFLSWKYKNRTKKNHLVFLEKFLKFYLLNFYLRGVFGTKERDFISKDMDSESVVSNEMRIWDGEMKS